MIEIVTVTTEEERSEAYSVRTRVFVDEQGVPAEIEIDELDSTADHFLARLDGQAVGAGRLVAQDGRGVLGRLAVLDTARGTGLGALLVRAIEERARERGLTRIELHAQTQAQGFYERLGYQAFGEPDWEDAGIEHIWMRKRLE
ncbi:GNAT family N-acetyltransferase [Nocardia sp. NPDC050406]|uniref:GNAT family N-acetyltransferase n=1 Tax=Nocardia sp. NPDC050406 TaxID=3364318 RepID=UPI00378B6CB7